MQDEVTVTQIDREAAANWFFEPTEAEVCEPFCRAIREGRDDGNTLVQTLARHRAQAERETLARMEAVAWMYEYRGGVVAVTATRYDRGTIKALGYVETPLYALPPAPEAGQ